MAKTGPFEKYGDRYDGWFERHGDAYHAELEALRRVVPPSPARGVEVGVGSGKFAVPLGIKTGVEPSKNMADRAEQRGIRVFRNVAERLPFPQNEFDYVLFVTTICFVDDVSRSFREAFRVLKPGGCLIAAFVDRESALGKRYIAKRAANVFYKEAVFYSAEEVGGCITDAGFGHVVFKQTLIPGEKPILIRDGYGQGGFVVVKGIKKG